MPLDFNDVPSGGPRPYDPAEWEHRVEKVRAALRNRAREFVAQMYPYARIQRGQARMGSIRGDKGESFVIETEGERAGLWHEFANDGSILKQGGDLIDLWMHDRACDFPTALAELEQHMGLDTSKPAWSGRAHKIAQERQAYAKAHPPEPDAEEVSRTKYLYQSADGKTLLAVVHRLLMSDGTKTFRQQRQKPDGSGLEWGSPEVRPLYRLPQIVAEPVVVLVEGEKCADHLAGLGVPATTVMGGSSTILDKTDFSPLARKTVILWPDNDHAGQDFMTRVGSRLLGIGCVVKTVAIPEGKPEKWDAADAGDDEARSLLASQLDQLGENKPVGPPPGGRLRLYSLAELRQLPPPEWRIEGIFPTHGASTIYGAYESFKTFVALDMALSLATSQPWQGREVKPCPVVYVAGEGQAGVTQRASGWIAAKNGGHDPEPGRFMILPEAVAMSATGDLEAFVKLLEELPEMPGLIVLDTITRMTGGGSLNDEKDVQAYVRGIDYLRAMTRAHIMNIGHSGKDKDKGLMGSVVLPAAMETIIQCQREDMTVTLCNGNPFGKQKDGPNFDDIRLELKPVEFDFGRGIESTLVPDMEVIGTQTPDAKPARKRDRRRKPTGSYSRVMNAYARLVTGPKGFRIPCTTENGVKEGTMGVTLNDLREAAFELGLTSTDEPEMGDPKRDGWRRGRNQTFVRAVDWLCDNGWLRSETGFVWELFE